MKGTSDGKAPARVAEPHGAVAKAVGGKLERSVVPGKVRLVLRIELTGDRVERLTARAIRTERTLESLVTEILEGAD